jgi:mono/diheme cytochrome c family protein
MIVVFGFVSLMMSAGPALAQDSEALYTQKCANCHAKDGSGRTDVTFKLAVPDLRSKRIAEMSDADIYNSIAHGTQHKEYPHAFLHTGMTEQQIQGLAKYIRGLQRSSQHAARRETTKP